MSGQRNGESRKNWGLVIVVLLGVIFWAGTVGYIVVTNRGDAKAEAERLARASTMFDYRSCLDRNELRSVIHTILEAALAQPPDQPVTKEAVAYRALIRSYLRPGAELEPADCPAILRREIK